MATRRRKKAATKARTVKASPDQILIRDDRLVIITRSRAVTWHHGLTRTAIGVGKSIRVHPDGGIIVGTRTPRARR